MQKKPVIFYSNTKPDENRCAQACLRMILATDGIQKDWLELDRMTHRRKNGWTWMVQVVAAMQKMSYRSKLISPDDLITLSRATEKYMRWYFWPDQAEKEKKHADMRQVSLAAKVCLQDGINTRRYATITDIKKFLKQGWYVIASVNVGAMQNKLMFNNHLVLVLKIDAKKVIFHDPGLPPQKNRSVPVKLFARAMNGSIIALKK